MYSFERSFSRNYETALVIKDAYLKLQNNNAAPPDETDALVEIYQRLPRNEAAKERADDLIQLLKMATWRLLGEENFLLTARSNLTRLCVTAHKEQRTKELKRCYTLLTRALKNDGAADPNALRPAVSM